MKRGIWRSCILLGLFVCFRTLPLRATEVSSDSLVTVAVHNDAGVPAGTLIEAEQTARAIFKRAGVDVTLINCRAPATGMQIGSTCRTTEFPRHLQMRIVRRSLNLRESVFGVSFLDDDGNGCYSDVFLEPAQELHERLHISLATLLGNVVAHEIAHLLLGTNGHSARGIMRAHWQDEDLAQASRGELLFTGAQGRTMREKVFGSLCRAHRITAAAAPGTD